MFFLTKKTRSKKKTVLLHHYSSERSSYFNKRDHQHVKREVNGESSGQSQSQSDQWEQDFLCSGSCGGTKPKRVGGSKLDKFTKTKSKKRHKNEDH